MMFALMSAQGRYLGGQLSGRRDRVFSRPVRADPDRDLLRISGAIARRAADQSIVGAFRPRAVQRLRHLLHLRRAGAAADRRRHRDRVHRAVDHGDLRRYFPPRAGPCLPLVGGGGRLRRRHPDAVALPRQPCCADHIDDAGPRLCADQRGLLGRRDHSDPAPDRDRDLVGDRDFHDADRDGGLAAHRAVRLAAARDAVGAG